VSERELSVEDIRGEHLEEVNERAHWAYLFGVLVFGTVLMLAFIALLDALG
jgi:hypothetical protein